MTTTIKQNLIIILSAIFLWLIITAGAGWWLWVNYQQIKKPDISQVQEANVQLDVETLNQAVEIINK